MKKLKWSALLLLAGMLCSAGENAAQPQASGAAKPTAKNAEAAFFTPLAEGVTGAPALRIADLTGGDLLLKTYCSQAAGALGWSVEVIRCKELQAASGDFDAVVLEDPKAVQPGPDQELLPYAAIPVLVAVSPGLPLRSISMKDLKRIYSGRISYWNELDPALPHLAIRRIVPDDQTPAYRAFALTVMGQPFDGSAPAFGDAVLPGAIAVSSWKTAAVLLRDLPGMIAFGPWQEKPLQGIPFLAVDGVAPERAAIVSGPYPAVLRRYAVVRKGGIAGRLFRKMQDPALARVCKTDPAFLTSAESPATGKESAQKNGKK